jgi:predicted Fe-S protein YdhL (DUF1289 family)
VVKSPCIDVCKMEAGLCAGCFRTIDEIARWSRIDDDEKRLILLAVAQRRSQPDSGGRAPGPMKLPDAIQVIERGWLSSQSACCSSKADSAPRWSTPGMSAPAPTSPWRS